MAKQPKKTKEPELISTIINYYTQRGLVWPDAKDAVIWALTELAEVAELLMSREAWVRNNPDDKAAFSKELLSEELSDVIMMMMVAGISEGVDPMDSLLKKIERKLDEHKEKAAAGS